MMSASTVFPTTPIPRPSSRRCPVEDRRERLRLRLKPKAPTTGWADGGWWPRSRNLAAELPGLLSVPAVRTGRVERVSYQLGERVPTLDEISCGGGVVRLDGGRIVAEEKALRRQVGRPGRRPAPPATMMTRSTQW